MAAQEGAVIVLPMFDERKCPACGKTFIIRCRPDEWGCVTQAGQYSNRQGNVLLCSIGCMRRYEQMALEASAERVRGLKAYRIWHLSRIENRSTAEIVKLTGVPTHQVAQMAKQIDLFYWREAEWLTAQEQA